MTGGHPAPGAGGIAEGRFTDEKLATALTGIAAEAGIDPTDARLLRFTTNAVFLLPAAGAVVRIAGSQALRHRVAKVVRVATWLAEYDLPTVRLLPGVPQPVESGPYLATVWTEVPTGGRRPTGRDLAAALRTLHDLPRPPFDLPSWSPLDDVRRRLGDAEELADDDQEFLSDRCAELEARLAELEFPLAESVVHGDAHLGNLIPSAAGAVLCDFDSTCLGPPEWDLTPIPVGLHRFGGSPRPQRQLAAAYGFDVTGWPGFEVLRDVRELKLVTSVLPIMRSNPKVAAELRRRLASVRSGDTTARWSRYR